MQEKICRMMYSDGRSLPALVMCTMRSQRIEGSEIER